MVYYSLQMSANLHTSNILTQTKFPFNIPQSQPQEGDKRYMQHNFLQPQLTLNASIDNPRVRVLTPPWAMHRPDESCPFYAPGGEFEKERGTVQTGYKLDYGRTNHEINVKANKDKNKWSKIRQMKPNEYVDITDPDLAEITIRDDEATINPYVTETFQSNTHFFGNTERFTTIRSKNFTAGDLVNYQFHSPHERTYNDHNKPIKREVREIPNDSTSKYVPVEDMHKYSDNVTIKDDFLDNTQWSNESLSESFCPVKHAIELKEQAAKDSWNQTENKAVNRESFRRNVHRDMDNKNINNPMDDGKEGFYFKGKRVTVADRFKDRKLYEKYTAKGKVPKENAKKESFTCQCQPYLDSMYTHILESRAAAIVMYLLKDPSFKPWIKEWEFLQRNINKCNMDFKQLADDHEDVAYSLDKGKELSFRFRDKDRYLPLSVESYILAHEMAHVANEEIGHGNKFQELMHLIEVAAYMLQFIDLSKYSDSTVHSNGQEILSRNSIKYELRDGIENLIKHSESEEQKEYWYQILKRVENNK